MDIFQFTVATLGGLAIFVYGMSLMSEGLTQVAGDRMKAVLAYVTRNRVAAILAGGVVTMIIQSLSARAGSADVLLSPHRNGRSTPLQPQLNLIHYAPNTRKPLSTQVMQRVLRWLIDGGSPKRTLLHHHSSQNLADRTSGGQR